MTRQKRLPLVHEKHFAHATRDTGYKSTAAAISELVDNSIQAGAKSVRVFVRQSGVGKAREITIGVWDDGCGMDKEVLQQALQFGGSTRFNDRTGLGRFGMGLPNSSVSQARRVRVFSWRSAKRILSSYLDLDEIGSGRMRAVPTPVVSDLPDWAPALSPTGTMVVWSKCDRLDFRKGSTIQRKLRRELGRMFRHLLWEGVNITVNQEEVVAIDPMFCHPNAEMSGAEPYLEPLTYDVRLPGDPQQTGTIVVRFSRLPVDAWHDLPTAQKRRAGIVGGAGTSIIRGGREIAHGWYFMGGKRRQNYDDWWRCELSFEPGLDELFGVPHSKQGVRPTAEISEIIAADVEPIAHQLSGEVRADFAALKKNRNGAAANLATNRDWRLPRLPVESEDGGAGAVTQLNYRTEIADLATSSFVQWKVDDGHMVMTLNRNHPFFRRVYERGKGSECGWITHNLECMLLAFARATEMTEHMPDTDVLPLWSDVLATFLGE